MENKLQAGLKLTIGELFGDRYRIVMQIGKGGMGRVYLAEDIRLGNKLRALKLTRPLPDESRSFLPEAQLLSELDHPHLPAITDYFPPDEEGIACIVMDYVAGDTLAERFERYGFRLPFGFVLRVLIQLCEVLIYLHGQNVPIVFRDLKPANVLLDRHNEAILVDFGIARRYQPGRVSDTLQLGTPGFAAPEQLRGEQSDSRTDMYGLGALAYHLLSGGKFARQHQGELKRALQGDVPREFALLLGKLLADHPIERPQSASQLWQELTTMQQENDHSIGKEDGIRTGEEVVVVAIVSAYPGAGATLTALVASSSLARLGIAHALVECPGGEAEMYSWLDGARKMPKGAVYAEASGLQPAAPAWRKGSAAYYPLNPFACLPDTPSGSFADWLGRLGVPVVLLDISSRWEQQGMREWIIHTANQLWMVGDCYPMKWSPQRQAACIELQKLANQRKRKISWIANRDQSFRERKQWLELFPAKPVAFLPELTSPTFLHVLWQGEGFAKISETTKRIDAALKTLIRTLGHNN